jgi:hypothetical protein
MGDVPGYSREEGEMPPRGQLVVLVLVLVIETSFFEFGLKLFADYDYEHEHEHEQGRLSRLGMITQRHTRVQSRTTPHTQTLSSIYGVSSRPTFLKLAAV